MSRPIGIDVPDEPNTNPFLDFLVSTALISLCLAATTAFYYYGQLLELEIRKIDDDRVVVESELKQCNTARQAIEKYRTQLQTLTEKLTLAKKKKKSHNP